MSKETPTNLLLLFFQNCMIEANTTMVKIEGSGGEGREGGEEGEGGERGEGGEGGEGGKK